MGGHSRGAGEHAPGGHLDEARRQTVFQEYIAHFKKYHLRPGQKNQKNAAEARLKRVAGDRICAFVVWEIGFPRLSEAPATEQRQDRNARLQTDAKCVVDWLSTVARALRERRCMSHYAVARARSGHEHGVSPLTEEQAKDTAEMKMATQRLRKGCKLQGVAGRRQLSAQEQQLLWEYQQGTLQARVDEMRSRREGLALRLGQLVSSEETDASRNTRSAASAVDTVPSRRR